MKKLTLIFLATALFFIFAGCGDSGTKTDNDQTDDDVVVDDTETPDEAKDDTEVPDEGDTCTLAP